MSDEKLTIHISVPNGTLAKITDGDVLAKGLKEAIGDQLVSQNLLDKEKVSSLDLDVAGGVNKNKGKAGSE